MFFSSWELWEQMTFILALAILVVFIAGWSRLAWRVRREKESEIADLEKRSKIQELRDSGLIVESRKKAEIPFGVRAIQSGIQVDGIWISQSATPEPSEFKRGSIFADSSGESMKSGQASLAERARRVPRLQTSGFNHEESIGSRPHSEIYLEPLETGSVRQSYKPRRSSQLRFGNKNHDEESLHELESDSPTSHSKKKVHTHRPRGSRKADLDADSSAADNERNSGTSSDSDATLSQSLKPTAGESSDMIQNSAANREIIASVPCAISLQPSGTPGPAQTSSAESFTYNKESARRESYYLFEAPCTPSSPEKVDSSRLVRSEAGPSRPRSPPLFIPGELHVNKAARKVNSGFEVLPAGTFGHLSEFKGKRVDHDQDDNAGDKLNPGKLQKKNRLSASGIGQSGTTERT